MKGSMRNLTKKPSRKLRIGGVLRCCADTLYTLPDEEVKEVEGQVLQCKHCKDHELHRLVYKGDAWEWLNPSDKE